MPKANPEAAMAGEDRNDDAPSAPKGRRRRKPPVLELEATEVGAGGGAQAKPRASDAPRDAEAPKAEESTFEWRALLSLAPVASAAAAVVGAVAAILVVLLFSQGTDPRVTKLASDVAALSQRLDAASPAGGADPAAVATLSQRVDRLAAALADAEKRVAALASRPTPMAPDLAPLNERIARLESALGQLQAATRERPAAATPASVEAMEKRIGALEDRLGALAASTRASVAPAVAAEIVALSALRDALGSGAPFATELAAVRALLGERAAKLQSLDAFAEKGLPTTAELSQRFAQIAPAIAREPEAEGDYLSRLMTSASRLIEVRPVGEARGDSTGAIAARTENRLRHNDLAGALAEAERFPPAAKAVAADWIAAAKQRRDAEVLVKNLIVQSLTALAGERKP
jgi:hypothetical protein